MEGGGKGGGKAADLVGCVSVCLLLPMWKVLVQVVGEQDPHNATSSAAQQTNEAMTCTRRLGQHCPAPDAEVITCRRQRTSAAVSCKSFADNEKDGLDVKQQESDTPSYRREGSPSAASRMEGRDSLEALWKSSSV